jgi:hypothetical protein
MVAMIKKISIVVAAVACLVFVIIVAPSFAREIVGKFQAGTFAHAIAPAEAGCARAPWPYGCDWRATADHKKKIAKNDRSHHNRRGWTIVRGNGFSANDEL